MVKNSQEAIIDPPQENQRTEEDERVSKNEIFDMIMDDPNNGNLRQRIENNKSLASRFTEEELLAELASRQNKILGNESNPIQKDEDEDKVDIFTPDQGKPASEIKFE